MGNARKKTIFLIKGVPLYDIEHIWHIYFKYCRVEKEEFEEEKAEEEKVEEEEFEEEKVEEEVALQSHQGNQSRC